MFASIPPWVRVSALVLGVGLGSEILYEAYLGWSSYCAGCRARQRAACHMNDVYFANERSIQPNAPGTTMASFTTEHVRRIVALLDRARVSVNLCMYIVTVESIGDALLRAAKRGVHVRVVGCSSMAYSSGSQMTKLVEGGIPVRFNRKNGAYLMHHKFCLIDTDWFCPRCYHEEKVRKYGFCCGSASVAEVQPAVASGAVCNGGAAAGPSATGAKNGKASGSSPSKVPCVDNGSRCVRCDRQKKSAVEKCKLQETATEVLPLGGLVMSGSTNWTMQALSSNWDNMVVTSMPELVTPFQMEFQRMWKEFASLPPLIAIASASSAVDDDGTQ